MQRIEVADFSGNGAIESRGVKMRDRANAAHSGQEIFPDIIGAYPQTTD
jgi:hypothetical protein